MLSKLKKIPLKVVLSGLFLLTMFAVAMWFIPPLGITIIVSVATVYSLVTLVTYWDICR